jgi:hypothetical protein
MCYGALWLVGLRSRPHPPHASGASERVKRAVDASTRSFDASMRTSRHPPPNARRVSHAPPLREAVALDDVRKCDAERRGVDRRQRGRLADSRLSMRPVRASPMQGHGDWIGR